MGLCPRTLPKQGRPRRGAHVWCRNPLLDAARNDCPRRSVHVAATCARRRAPCLWLSRLAPRSERGLRRNPYPQRVARDLLGRDTFDWFPDVSPRSDVRPGGPGVVAPRSGDPRRAAGGEKNRDCELPTGGQFGSSSLHLVTRMRDTYRRNESRHRAAELSRCRSASPSSSALSRSRPCASGACHDRDASRWGDPARRGWRGKTIRGVGGDDIDSRRGTAPPRNVEPVRHDASPKESHSGCATNRVSCFIEGCHQFL